MSGVLGKPDPDQDARAQASAELRQDAIERAETRGRARTRANGEELAYGDTFAANYHKSLPHGPTGFVEPAIYRDYVDAVLNQDHARFEGLPAGENFPAASFARRTVNNGEGRRTLTSPFTGHVYDLEGTDAGALALDAAPALASDELAAELAEVYVMALLRDESFADIAAGGGQITTLTNALSGMAWFSGTSSYEAIGSRRRTIGGPADLFRGSTPGSRTGPWLSQYLLVGNKGPDTGTPQPPEECKRASIRVEDGYVFYGSQFIDQRSIVAKPGVDWLQTWASWLDAQNGVQFGGRDEFRKRRLFLTRPRDIATYVHFDALYQAYHVASNLMLAGGASFDFDRGMPETVSRTRAAFASFGGPHVLGLVAEVSTRALKLVWRQKWQHHRRLRPEVAAALVTLYANDDTLIPNETLRGALAELHGKIPAPILTAIANKNKTNAAKNRIPANSNTAGLPAIANNKNFLLPMAFPEGSPTHPAYGAGHATVAGACVTVLKAFFEMYDEDGDELPWPVADPGPGKYGFGNLFVGDGPDLEAVTGGPTLTVQGELDKLAANISIARNMAGVHYYTDYFASVRMGERVAVSILEEQAALFNEPVSMSFTSFDRDRMRVRGHNGTATVSVVDRDGHAVDASDWYQRYGN
jgi:hypothetical protein